ncbi:LPD29 domain-containing protein [Anaerococcus vaginalis]|uniref:LPD29 domain-containing protein n=1 Tax=Anaerococcus vaginalis TaxID=33037 RepID=UPI002915575E|nr:LPD29 domain-containing protein [Anaerococcus vaginalis]MDU5825252.1 LPD29 domain-containing protein [Anaerococcus vaginalis]MDU7143017.1 LPD29 domain-containing protein [Anaerococcus vaginalis]
MTTLTTNYPYNNTVGKNYDINLTTKEIAKEVKKQARKLYPEIKISARSEYNAIFITIKAKEENEETREMKQTVEALLNSYNYDKGDVITDYFDSNFYGFVELELI